MAKKSKSDYLGLGYVISVLLAILPPTCWILGIVTRILDGKIIAGLIRIPLGIVMWIPDMICMLVSKRICRILNI